MSLEELTKKAQEEIQKINNVPLSDSQKQEQASAILNQSMMFADKVLKELVAHTMGKNIDELFEVCLETSGGIGMYDQNSKKSYMMCLQLVDKDYMLDLGELSGKKPVIDRITFLLNTVKVIFCPIKDLMKSHVDSFGGEEFNYVLQLAHNTTLFLDKDSEKRIGVVIKEVLQLPSPAD